MLTFVNGFISQLFNGSNPTGLTQQAPSYIDRDTTTLPGTRNLLLPKNAQRIHVVVLVHGWMGNPAELGYLKKSLEQKADNIEKEYPGTYFLVHSAIANEGKTSDGIASGGIRLAREVNSLMKTIEEEGPQNVSLSIVGNSLGGLYARFALSEIEALNNTKVQPKVFCTTATPHLGVSKHTYLPLPRFAEFAVAYMLWPTGRDLFRYTDTIERLAVDDAFVRPLQKFQNRVAYANAYYTDFQVPTATAAFLGETDSVHKRVMVQESSSFIELRVQTTQMPLPAVENHPATTNELSRRLDALGWTKVFCDVRTSLPSLPIPFLTSAECPKSKDQYTSSELLNSLGRFQWDRWHAPLGHTVMVANSKNDYYAKLNAAGQPIMNQLAEELIQDILLDT